MTFEEEETIARNWIKNNPHVALCFVVQAHETYILCRECVLSKISAQVKEAYPTNFKEN